MADNSAIEWTDATWNPIRARNLKTGRVGWHCEHATTGCEFCYSEGLNKWVGTGLAFKPGHRKDIELFLDEEMLTQPLLWKKPRMIFVCSMTDLFADFVEDRWLDRMFSVMGACEEKGLGHTFQILTKRPARMLSWMQEHGHKSWNSCRLGTEAWPARNVWLGVSAERQDEANERIPLLLQTPAAIRFISAEPLLGHLDLAAIVRETEHTAYYDNALTGFRSNGCGGEHLAKLDWVIAGGESGSKARSMHPDWARSLRDQCAAAGVPFFFKQWGEWAPSTPEQASGNPRSGWQTKRAHPVVAKAEELYPEAGAAFVERVGKKAAGRLLDGIEHNDFPTRETDRGI
jgi:protein gp37